jgi:anthrone oxygenase-like protein
MLLGTLALAFAAAFSGATLYINLVEQPARLALDDNGLLSEWRPSDRRGFALLQSLALIAAVLGLASYFETQDVRWLIGAIIIVASWPYTYFAMVPMNNRILAISASEPGAARDLVRAWGLLEYGQSAIGLVACGAFVWAL